MSFVTTAAVIGGVSTAAGAIKGLTAGKPKAPEARNLGNELGQIGNAYDEFLSKLTGGTGSFQSSGFDAINQLLNPGGVSFDAASALRSMSPQQISDIQMEAARTGRSAEQWLSDHVAANADSDPVAQLYRAQYSQSTPGLGGSLNDLLSQNRQANLNDVSNLSSQYQNIIQNANKPYYDQLNTFTQAANAPIQQSPSQQQAAAQASQGFGSFDPSSLYATSPSGSPLLSKLNDQAMNQGPSQIQQGLNKYAMEALANGGNLSPSELRNVQQASRAAFAARGLDGTNASVVDETLQTDAAQRARLLQNLGIASAAQNQGLAEQNLQQQFGLGVSGQNLGYGQLGLQTQQANQNFGLNSFNANLNSQLAQNQALQNAANLAEVQRQSQLQAQLQAVNAQAAGRIDPFSAILQGTNDQTGALLGFYGQNQSSQNNLLSSLLGYGSDLNNTNYNANAAANIAGYNGGQSLAGSLIGSGTGLLGSYLGTKGGAKA